MNEDNLIKLSDNYQDEDIDYIAELVARFLKEEDKLPQVIVPGKIARFHYIYRVLCLYFNTNSDVSYTIHKPFKGDGNISVVSSEFNINNKLLQYVMAYVDVIDILPTRDGRVRMDFSFSGLTERV